MTESALTPVLGSGAKGGSGKWAPATKGRVSAGSLAVTIFAGLPSISSWPTWYSSLLSSSSPRPLENAPEAGRKVQASLSSWSMQESMPVTSRSIRSGGPRNENWHAVSYFTQSSGALGSGNGGQPAPIGGPHA